jgi:hypothetical protein
MVGAANLWPGVAKCIAKERIACIARTKPLADARRDTKTRLCREYSNAGAAKLPSPERRSSVIEAALISPLVKTICGCFDETFPDRMF